jgi:hypothetical protein
MLFTASWKIILATFLTGLVVDRMLAAMEHWHRCGERRFT